MQCDKCKRVLPVELPGRVRCLCGHVFYCDGAKNQAECIHRGDVAGTADCDCAGKPKVFQCDIHGLAMEHKFKPGKIRVDIGGKKSTVEMAYCSFCKDERKVPDGDDAGGG